jgi:hypothetical protein
MAQARATLSLQQVKMLDYLFGTHTRNGVGHYNQLMPPQYNPQPLAPTAADV